MVSAKKNPYFKKWCTQKTLDKTLIVDFFSKLKVVLVVSTHFHKQKSQIKTCFDFHFTLFSVEFEFRGFRINLYSISTNIIFPIGMFIINLSIKIG